MSIDQNLLIAQQIIKKHCIENYDDDECVKCELKGKHTDMCPIPMGWEIPDPTPEPTERPRIEWLRMLPDMEMLLSCTLLLSIRFFHPFTLGNFTCVS